MQLRTPIPAGLADTRRALHRIAQEVVSPARVAATGNEIALEPRPGGYGTPPFPDGGEVRVEGAEIVFAAGDGSERRERLEDVEEGAARYLGDFWAFAADLLEQLRAEAGPALEASPVRLWPEHFDVAIELGAESAGLRAAYGGSPGDDEHDEPYLYVAPWNAPAPGPLWNASAFNGAELPLVDLLRADDARSAGLAFFRERLAALTR